MSDLPISSFSASNPGAELRAGDQLILHDRESTQRAYDAIESGGTTDCGCSLCRNFIAQKPSAYPPSFLDLLELLGINPAKEGEVYEWGPTDNGDRSYGGWFFLTAQIIERGESHVSKDGIEYWFASGLSLPRPNGDFGLDLLALNFTTSIPWVLEETP